MSELNKDTNFSFVRNWFYKAYENSKKMGKMDSAELWKDGFQHLEKYYKENERLKEKVSILHDSIHEKSNIAQSIAIELRKANKDKQVLVEALEKINHLNNQHTIRDAEMYKIAREALSVVKEGES